MLGGGELGLGVHLHREIRAGGGTGDIAPRHGGPGLLVAVAGLVPDAAEQARARFVGHRGPGQLAGLLRCLPFGPEQVEVGLAGSALGRREAGRAAQQPLQVQRGGDGIGDGGAGCRREVGAESDLRVGQQAGVEHLGHVHLGRCALGPELGTVQHRQDGDLIGIQAIAGVDHDGLQRLQPELRNIDLQVGDRGCGGGRDRQGPRARGGAGGQQGHQCEGAAVTRGSGEDHRQSRRSRFKGGQQPAGLGV